MIKLGNIPKWYLIKSDSEDFTDPEKLATYQGEMSLSDFITMIRSYISNLYAYGVSCKSSGGYSSADLINDAEADFTVNHMLMLSCIKGVTVDGFNPYIKILTTNMSNDVAEGMPYRIKDAVMSEPTEEDDDTFVPVILEPERPKMWSEYLVNNHYPTVIEEYTYFKANWGNGNMCPPLSLTQLMSAYVSPDVELVTDLPLVEEIV